MDAFEAADYEALLPRRWKKRMAIAFLLFAVLFPNQLRDIFVVQVERHAQHLTAEFLKMMLPETSPNAPRPAPAPLPKQAGSKE
jgi:hypothetical protein